MSTNRSDDYADGTTSYNFDELADLLFEESLEWSAETGYDILIDFKQYEKPNLGGGFRKEAAFYGDSYELEVFVNDKSIGEYDSFEEAELALREFRDASAVSGAWSDIVAGAK